MEAKFSPRVKDVLSFSREEALRLGNDFIGVEHFLLGILREGEGNAVRILTGFNLDLQKLKAELDQLWRVERPDVTQKVSWAASLGDRSENADYHYNKKRLREIDRRVLYLRKCIDDLKVVHYSPFQEGKVMFGAWVEIENDNGDRKRIRIVGYDEIFNTKDYISIDSPMAHALMKKQVGDEAVVKTGAGEFVWRVTKIEYQK